MIVIGGDNARIPPDRKTGASLHTLFNVYREMLWQICRDYNSLPDTRTITMREIRFFYDGLRPELQRHTKPG